MRAESQFKLIKLFTCNLHLSLPRGEIFPEGSVGVSSGFQGFVVGVVLFERK